MIGRQKLVDWIHNKFAIRNLADKEFYDYLKGKRIIMVGPAPYLEGRGLGKEIDSYDVVIRINHGIVLAKTNPEDYGSKTNVLYVNQKMRLHYQLDYPPEWLNEISFINAIYQKFPFERPAPCIFCKKPIFPGDAIDFEFDANKQGFFTHCDCLPRNHSKLLNEKLSDADKHLPYHDRFRKVYPNLTYREVFNEIIPHSQYQSYVYSEEEAKKGKSNSPPEFLLGGLLTYLDVIDKINRTGSEMRLAGFDFYANLIQNEENQVDDKKKMDIYMNNYLKIYSKDYAIIEHSDEQEAQCFPHFDQQQEQLKLFYLLTQLIAKGDHKVKLNIDDHLYKLVFDSKNKGSFTEE